ncbi:glycoside hydrolase family 15 protein [Streptomyces goshikiensis]|uniref:glycoside hydrolase family 15 protein n=1 Tax=Streptomyces goshikiensis TaxID=1942 RepID=UPI003646DDC2
MSARADQRGLVDACAALRDVVDNVPYDQALPPAETLAVRIGQSAWLTRRALRELDADGEIALMPQEPTRRLRPSETHPADTRFTREIRNAILSGHCQIGMSLPVRRRGLNERRIARMYRPLLAEGLLVRQDGPDGPRFHVAVPVPDEDGPGPIEDYALIGDQRGSALVRRTGSIDWLCLRRFDSDALFARLLGTADHGFWQLAPVHLADASTAPVPVRRYVGASMVHEIEWVTKTGVARVTDFMVPGGVEAPQVVRIVTGVQGEVAMRTLLRARPEYGLVVPRLDRTDGWHVAINLPEAGGRLWSQASVPLQTHDGDIYAAFTITEGETVTLGLAWREGSDAPASQPAPNALLKCTLDHWREWATRCTYPGADRADVLRSLLVLSALTHAPTGAIVAAPTTSLPEAIGGDRTWDYRYGWLRDGAFSITALTRCGYLDEALAWKDWMIRSCADTPERRRIMYRVDGATDLHEQTLPHLPGYENSAPARIGNGAADQLQLDVYGEVADALFEAALDAPGAAPGIAAVIVDLATELEPLWHEPDMGIWEIRGSRRQFTHSKVMAWVALDRAIKVIERGWATGPLERWRALRETIHTEVCERGYDHARKTFTQSYGSRELDASLLHAMLAEGFLPADDKRVIGTIEAVQRELGTDSGLLLRYRTAGDNVGVDGLVGDEGHFLICTGWLAMCLVLIGRVEEAQAVLARLRSLRNDVGLLSEEYDPQSGRQLGNFPQAFSHLAEICAAVAIRSASVDDEHAAVAAGTAS